MNIWNDWIQVITGRIDMPTREVIEDNEYELEMEENRTKLAALVSKQRKYLIQRGKCIMTSGHASYRTSAATDVKKTMREYVDEELPTMKDSYKFLYVTNI